MNNYKERTIICKGCGEEVTDNFRPNQKYCSLECYRNSSRPQRKNGKKVSCDWCGEDIYKPKVHLEKSEHHFCSVDCQIEWQSRNKVEFECEVCEKKFKLPKSRAESDNVRFCSIECRDESDEWDGSKKGGLAVIGKNTSPTKLELEGRELLEDLGFTKGEDFFERTTLHEKFNVDIWFPDQKVIIEWDGEYWHGHPSMKPLNDHQKYIRQRDKSQDAYFAECGYITLRFWSREVWNTPEEVKKEIRGVIDDN